MDPVDIPVPQATADALIADLVELSVQLRVESESRQQSLCRGLATEAERAECRGHIRALLAITERLDRLVDRQVPEGPRRLLRYRIDAEASRRLAQSPRADAQEG